jgi:phosphatidylglycerol lysyltransferase
VGAASRTSQLQGGVYVARVSTERAFALVRRFGREAISFQALTAGCEHWFDGDAFVAYVHCGGAWIAVGSPIAAPERETEVALRFIESARRRGVRARFFGSERTWPASAPISSTQIGEQPVWTPAAWPGGLSKKLARQIRQHRARGHVVVRELDRHELADPRTHARRGLERVRARWIAHHRSAPLAFLVEPNLYALVNERRYFVAEHAGSVVCAIIAMPVYGQQGFLLETFMRDPLAPGGAMELVFDHALCTFAAQGSHYVSYGLCPLTGTASPLHALVRRSARGLYDFEGLRHFKEKFRPTRWEPVYLAYPRGDLPARAMLDALAAFCPGGIVRYGARTLAKSARDWLGAETRHARRPSLAALLDGITRERLLASELLAL